MAARQTALGCDLGALATVRACEGWGQGPVARWGGSGSMSGEGRRGSRGGETEGQQGRQSEEEAETEWDAREGNGSTTQGWH